MIEEIIRLVPIIAFFMWVFLHVFFIKKLFQIQKTILDRIIPKSFEDENKIFYVGSISWIVFTIVWLFGAILFGY
ncbi:hypothetical protein NGC69_00880 [Enterococcus lactis]|uniref:hypothetical protein n=1 Tax=Enterococcus lactis TaxID=357441 RepID=UPI002DBDFE13|nr:hypothetical protein [Enterococcus lactis]MEB7841649.1 hypothetical protein [Enterococcus lactis]MEB7854028.1 hypothetical protein [Enterococcus lactis]